MSGSTRRKGPSCPYIGRPAPTLRRPLNPWGSQVSQNLFQRRGKGLGEPPQPLTPSLDALGIQWDAEPDEDLELPRVDQGAPRDPPVIGGGDAARPVPVSGQPPLAAASKLNFPSMTGGAAERNRTADPGGGLDLPPGPPVADLWRVQTRASAAVVNQAEVVSATLPIDTTQVLVGAQQALGLRLEGHIVTHDHGPHRRRGARDGRARRTTRQP